jgi:DNA modification methylase
LGFGFIGFEKEKEYVDVAKARINGVITIDGWIK